MGLRGWVAYDGQCWLCTTWARRLQRVLERRGYRLVTLQTPWVRRLLGLAAGERPDQMWLIRADGRAVGGADAAVAVARHVWWAWPIVLIAALPFGRRLLTACYDWLARHRGCAAKACAVSASTTRSAAWSAWSAWLALVVLPVAVLLAGAMAGAALPAWALMWLLALAVFAGCRWLTFCTAVSQGGRPTRRRTLGYLLAWPGMNAATFLSRASRPTSPSGREVTVAVVKTLLGAALLWLVARRLIDQPLLAGWVGMVGLILLLHFGLFHLLSLCWRRAGVEAPPLMNTPLAATSVGSFWGKRWNVGFQQLAHRYVFGLLHRRIGAAAALMAAFVVSGLVHDLVISIPARGGYGLPTVYFALQGAALLFERSRPGRRLGLRCGLRGRLFTAMVVAAPVCLLLHPPFVQRVMVPFMHAIGAL